MNHRFFVNHLTWFRHNIQPSHLEPFNHPNPTCQPLFFWSFLVGADLRLRLKACESCQGFVSVETEDVNSVNATDNTSTLIIPSTPLPPQGCFDRWRSRKISKICAAGGVCWAVLLSISLISQIIGCFVYAVSSPRPSWTEGMNGEPRVAYWCFWNFGKLQRRFWCFIFAWCFRGPRL